MPNDEEPRYRTELSEDLLGHDVDVSWWVTPEAYERGHYVTLYRTQRRWVTRSSAAANVRP